MQLSSGILGILKRAYTLNDWKEVSWDDVGGLSEAKRIMREIIEGPHKLKKFYEFYHKKPVKGALLFGPPGCGKTLLAMAIVTAVAKMYWYRCQGSYAVRIHLCKGSGTFGNVAR